MRTVRLQPHVDIILTHMLLIVPGAPIRRRVLSMARIVHGAPASYNEPSALFARLPGLSSARGAVLDLVALLLIGTIVSVSIMISGITIIIIIIIISSRVVVHTHC